MTAGTSRLQLVGTLAMAVAAAAFPLLAGSYELGLAITTALFVLSAMGFNLIAGFVGQLSFGQAGFFGVGAYASSLLLTEQHWSFVAAACAGTACGALVATVVGVLALRLNGVFFAIATLAAAQLLEIVANNWGSLTHGTGGVIGIPDPHITLGGASLRISSPASFYGLVVASIAVLYLLSVAASRSGIGRAMRATRENTALAEAVGVNTFAIKVVAFVISGSVAAYSGVIYGSYFKVVSPDLLGTYYSAMPLLIVILGGRGHVVGPILGGVLLIWVPALFNLVGPTRLVVLGCVLVGVTLLAPGGIAGAASDWSERGVDRASRRHSRLDLLRRRRLGLGSK